MKNSKSFTIIGNIVDAEKRCTFGGKLYINEEGNIENIEQCDVPIDSPYIIVPFVDSHMHIEMSMMLPAEYARVVIKHGSVACINDPHEIANVLGIDGINYMIENSDTVPFKFFFGMPSCVPVTSLETSGAVLDSVAVEKFMSNEHIYSLAEMMNYHGVVTGDTEVIAKINAALRANKVVDGHAPALQGEDLRKYAAAGISTDHECSNIAEAEEKIALGMKIQIREGSAAKNFEALYPLIDKYPEKVMFCTDDLHPDDLQEGCINRMVKMAISKNLDVYNVLKAASINAIKHYNLPVGMLRIGDNADFVVVDNLQDFKILQTYIDGMLVYDSEQSSITKFGEYQLDKVKIVNNFKAEPINIDSIAISAKGKLIRVIEVIDKELLTKSIVETAKIVDGMAVSDIERDILKIVVINRYTRKSKPCIAFIKNFGLKRGAICSTVANDSHNIIAVGVDDEAIVRAVNAVIDSKGGVSVDDGESSVVMPLPIAGLMSDKDEKEVTLQYVMISEAARKTGTKLTAPFMTLSFMALIVIPEIKIYDKSLFDVVNFRNVNLFL